MKCLWYMAGIALAASAAGPSGGELRFGLRADPKTLDPLLGAEEASETVAYLTSGVLIRLNRRTQELEPELATSWKISRDGKRIDFKLRRGVQFSDGAPLTPADVVATIQRLSSADVHSAIADTFRSGAGAISAEQRGEDSVSVTFSNAVAGVEGLFDQLAITRKGTPSGTVVLGPFVVSESRSGQHVLLRRNPHYWKTDEAGRRLPYLDSVRLVIQSERDIELLRFRRGEFQLVDKLDPDLFEQLLKGRAGLAVSAGPGLDPEFLWFNQSPAARIPAYKHSWFGSVRFRQAISKAINRDDLVRLVYLGRAKAARGPISEANIRWFDTRLPVPVHDPSAARALLTQDGFTFSGGVLRDRGGNPVEFSLITNAGSKTRGQIGAIVQEDLARIGIRLNLVPLEFQSLVERITRTQEYEACLLGLSNTELDPRTQINVFSSSGTHHAWNPGQPQPSTTWEKEMDRLLSGPVTSGNATERKRAYDRVQEIMVEQAAILYLVYPEVLGAIGPELRGAHPVPLTPHLFWNIDRLSLQPSANGPGGRGAGAVR